MREEAARVHYSRLLISNPGFYRHFRCKDFSLWVYDSSSLPFLVEEYLAHAAVEVLVPSQSLAARGLDDLPRVLRERVRVVDNDGSNWKAVNAVLAPLLDEWDIVASNGGEPLRPRKDGKHRTPREILRATEALYEELYDFLLGAKYQLQVGVRAVRLVSAVSYLRSQSRSPETRAFLAVIQGVVSTYRQLSIPGIALLSGATEEHAFHFQCFVEDEAYRKLSQQANNLGIATRVSRTVQLMERTIRRLAAKPAFKALFNTTSKSISAASDVPLPDADLIEALSPRGYLPPIIDMRAVYDRARKEWRKTRRSLDESFASVDLKPEDRAFFKYAEKHWGEPWREIKEATQPYRITRGANLMMTNASTGVVEEDTFGASALSSPEGG